MANKKDNKKIKEPVQQPRTGGRRPPQRELEQMRAEQREREMKERENIARIASMRNSRKRKTRVIGVSNIL